MLKYDETATLGKINVPSLIVVVLDIATVPAASIMKANCHSELVTLKPSGHMGLMEQNQLVCKLSAPSVLPAPNSTRLPKAEYHRSLER